MTEHTTPRVFHWCALHRTVHAIGEAQRGCSLAGPYPTREEAEAFGRRTDPEAFMPED